MTKLIKVLIAITFSTLSIMIIGFLVTNFIGLLLPLIAPELVEKRNFYTLPLSVFASPFAYYFSVQFVPYFVLVYFLSIAIFEHLYVNRYVGFSILLIFYFLYGYLVIGGEFWHTRSLLKYSNLTFVRWLSSSHKDMYFSFGSLLSSMLFIWILSKYHILNIKQKSKH